MNCGQAMGEMEELKSSVAVEDEGYGEEGRAKVKLDEGLPDNSSFF